MGQLNRLQKLAGINELEINEPNTFKLPNKLIVNSDAYKSFYQMVQLNRLWDINNWDNANEVNFMEKEINLFSLFTMLYSIIHMNNFTPNQMVLSKDNLLDAVNNYGIYTDGEEFDDEEDKSKFENFCRNIKNVNQRTI